MSFSPKIPRLPVVFLMLFFPGVSGTIVLRKVVVPVSWSIGEAESGRAGSRAAGLPLATFLIVGKKSDLTFVLNAGI